MEDLIKRKDNAKRFVKILRKCEDALAERRYIAEDRKLDPDAEGGIEIWFKVARGIVMSRMKEELKKHGKKYTYTSLRDSVDIFSKSIIPFTNNELGVSPEMEKYETRDYTMEDALRAFRYGGEKLLGA